MQYCHQDLLLWCCIPNIPRHLGLVIMVDLSQPNQLWFTLETLLTSLRNRVESVVNQMRTDHPSIRDDLKNEMWERLGIEHPVSMSFF